MLSRLRLPVIAAPMFLVSGIELVTAVCREGMVGAFPAANARTPERLTEWLGTIVGSLEGHDAAPFAVNINLSAGRYRDVRGVIDSCRAAATPLMITSVGDPTEMVGIVHDWGGFVLHDVTTMRHAEKAAAARVDGIILVCAGAGGHSGSASAFSLLRAVRRFYDGVIILAGGIGDGYGVAAARALGADLVYMGTRFIAAQESMAADAYKQLVVESQLSEIIYTRSISGVPANFMKTSIALAGLDPDALPELTAQGRPSLPPGKRAWKDIWSAGHAAALVDQVSSTARIAQQLREEYAEAVARLCVSQL